MEREPVGAAPLSADWINEFAIDSVRVSIVSPGVIDGDNPVAPGGGACKQSWRQAVIAGDPSCLAGDLGLGSHGGRAGNMETRGGTHPSPCDTGRRHFGTGSAWLSCCHFTDLRQTLPRGMTREKGKQAEEEDSSDMSGNESILSGRHDLKEA
uniref:Uncharacterized protein n=1 Tax=Steinernema glaseri TaxID=37863 RepID=A0A1I8ASG6_9BILA